jgi:TM2 domain-containing membrane protein YozV
LCWTEKADDYSAPRRASASVCQKIKNPARRPAESSIIAYFSQQRYIDGGAAQGQRHRKPRKMLLPRPFCTILQSFLFTTTSRVPQSMSNHKNKTLATALAFLFGGLGVHRFYLRGSVDRLGLLHVCSLPIAGLIYGAGQAPNAFWVLLPIFISCIVGFIEALAIGLTPDEKWDAKFNASSGRESRSNWMLAVLLVLTMLVGATGVIAVLSRLFDLLYTGGAYG